MLRILHAKNETFPAQTIAVNQIYTRQVFIKLSLVMSSLKMWERQTMSFNRFEL